MGSGRRLHKVSLLLLLATIIILFGFAVWVANNPQASEQYCQAHKTSKEECAHHSSGVIAMLWTVDFLNLFNPAITALSGIAVAGFTYALWVSTDKLWQASRDGQTDLLRSIVASERTADAMLKAAEAGQRTADAAVISSNAAARSADAAMEGLKIERPFLFIEITDVQSTERDFIVESPATARMTTRQPPTRLPP